MFLLFHNTTSGRYVIQLKMLHQFIAKIHYSTHFMLTTVLVDMTHKSKSLASSKKLQLFCNSLECLFEIRQTSHMKLWKLFPQKYQKTGIFPSVNITTPLEPWSQLAAQNIHFALQKTPTLT